MPPLRRRSGTPGGRPKELADVQQLAREKSLDAINTLAAIHADVEQPPTARIAAANSILDRAFGKAPQAVTGEGGEGPVLASIKVEFVRPGDGSGG